MSKVELQAMAKEMVDAVRGYVRRALAPLETRLSAAETRVGALCMLSVRGEQAAQTLPTLESLITRLAALEARPQLSYHGVWSEGYEHQPGDFVTDHGSMWYCWRATRSRPGTDEAWQLCVKRGRDAR